MRVQFGERIYFCTLATKTSGKLLLITTSNGVYTVDCKTEDNASYCYWQLLKKGWYNFSDYEYSN